LPQRQTYASSYTQEHLFIVIFGGGGPYRFKSTADKYTLKESLKARPGWRLQAANDR